VERRHLSLGSDALGADLGVIAYGHYGRPLLAFPAQSGHCWDYENHGMIDAIADLVDAGRVKVYCVDSWDGARCKCGLSAPPMSEDNPLRDRDGQPIKGTP